MMTLRHITVKPPARNSWLAGQSPLMDESFPDEISQISPHAIAMAWSVESCTARSMADGVETALSGSERNHRYIACPSAKASIADPYSQPCCQCSVVPR